MGDMADMVLNECIDEWGDEDYDSVLKEDMPPAGMLSYRGDNKKLNFKCEFCGSPCTDSYKCCKCAAQNKEASL